MITDSPHGVDRSGRSAIALAVKAWARDTALMSLLAVAREVFVGRGLNHPVSYAEDFPTEPGEAG